MDRSMILAHRSYQLAHGVSVRKEKFGLLFFNPKGPKLTFLHSGPWIHPEFFSGQFPLKKWLQNQNLAESEEKLLGVEMGLSRVLSKLVEKGLIVETIGDS